VDLYAYACVRACVRVYKARERETDRWRRVRGERSGEMQRETTNRRVEVADAIRRQCWRIAASSSGHNEPIRLYFYFRHASYRAIPSLEPRRLPRRRCAPRISIYTRAPTQTRARARVTTSAGSPRNTKSGSTAWRGVTRRRHARPGHATVAVSSRAHPRPRVARGARCHCCRSPWSKI